MTVYAANSTRSYDWNNTGSRYLITHGPNTTLSQQTSALQFVTGRGGRSTTAQISSHF
uniref:Uncharacterized protein n=1 Tax=Arundo donax TaxID=35708 RepID=A0A0A8ZNQ1_ARUDO